MKPSARLVDAAVFTGAHEKGHEGRRGNRLVSLGTALVTSVRSNLHHWLNLDKKFVESK